MPENGSGDGIYFSIREIGLIIALSVLAALTGALDPSYFFPESRVSEYVYGMLELPGPGAGVLIFGSILCFWLLLGHILVKKPGTAAAMATVLIAIDLLFGNQAVIIQSLDVLFIVAIIIETVCLFMAAGSSWKYILPLVLMMLSLVTLGIALLGLAKQGVDNIPLAQFPAVYYVFGILGLIYAVICYRYPGKYFLAAGLANMYYMLHFWLFWGDNFASRFPSDPAMIPVLFLVALLGGIISASAVYGIEVLCKRCRLRGERVQRTP
jgi:hypothetical protein